jgi:uncharacterized membrane protein YozB (DUF420 family)
MSKSSVAGRSLYWFFSFVVVILAVRWIPEGVEKAIPNMVYHLAERKGYLYTHMLASIIPMALVPLQLSNRFRAKYKQVHRWMGWAAVAGIYIGGLALFPLAMNQPLPAWGRAGFMFSGTVWIVAATIGFYFIRVGNIRLHRWWMMITAAVLFGAVTQRFALPVFIGFGFEFKAAYSLSAWSASPVNLSLFFLWQYRRKIRGLFGARRKDEPVQE